MIFQEPMSSLNPLFTVGDQIEEAILLHQTKNKIEAHGRAVEMLRRVGCPTQKGFALVPASALRRHAAAGDDRDGAVVRADRADRRRADHALDVTTEAQILELMRGSRTTWHVDHVHHAQHGWSRSSVTRSS